MTNLLQTSLCQIAENLRRRGNTQRPLLCHTKIMSRVLLRVGGTSEDGPRRRIDLPHHLAGTVENRDLDIVIGIEGIEEMRVFLLDLGAEHHDRRGIDDVAKLFPTTTSVVVQETEPVPVPQLLEVATPARSANTTVNEVLHHQDRDRKAQGIGGRDHCLTSIATGRRKTG